MTGRYYFSLTRNGNMKYECLSRFSLPLVDATLILLFLVIFSDCFCGSQFARDKKKRPPRRKFPPVGNFLSALLQSNFVINFVSNDTTGA
jgi:hypothetical protein